MNVGLMPIGFLDPKGQWEEGTAWRLNNRLQKKKRPWLDHPFEPHRDVAAHGVGALHYNTVFYVSTTQIEHVSTTQEPG